MTTIGPSLVITGEVSSQEDITIHGRVNGQIRMNKGALMVAPKGNVQATVHGASVTIHGSVTGDIAAADRIELTPTANVSGTLTTNNVLVQEGAIFNGVLDMDRAKVKGRPRPVAATVPEQAAWAS
jgi:cytoskeletal protein CcmA (bactofilin family)